MWQVSRAELYIIDMCVFVKYMNLICSKKIVSKSVDRIIAAD